MRRSMVWVGLLLLVGCQDRPVEPSATDVTGTANVLVGAEMAMPGDGVKSGGRSL